MGGSTARLNQHIGQLLNLLLGTSEGTQTTLSQLTSTLILAILQQFHATTLIGGKTNHLTNQVTNKLDTLTLILHKED